MASLLTGHRSLKPIRVGKGVSMHDPSSFGRWLQKRRKTLDITQEELAKRVGCALSTIRKIETGERRPSRQITGRLADQLGLTPEERSTFMRAARGALSPDTPTLTAPERSAVPIEPPARLLPTIPVPLTSLVGREKEINAICRLLANPDVRLLTLFGPPGIGKTRLGLQAARTLQHAFPEGVLFADLAPVGDPSIVPTTIAQLLGVREAGDLSLLESLRLALWGKRLLLLLDNFEHVLDAASFLFEMLTACPDLKMLVTSRSVLRIVGEHQLEVPPLELPDLHHLPPASDLAHYAAVELFLQRARALNPDFSLTEANADALARICVALDGLPLAIELAAARSKLFAPHILLARLNNRLALLKHDARNVPPRHQTLQAAIAWSYDLLDAEEQRLFRCLAVFSNGWTLEAATAICNDSSSLFDDHATLDKLSLIADKGLIRQHVGNDGEPRFVMLETVREYALERLIASSEEGSRRNRHATYYLMFAEQAEAQLHGPQQASSLIGLEVEHGNLRAALEWCLTGAGDRSIGGKIAAALWEFWYWKGYVNEGMRWVREALGNDQELPVSVRIKLLQGASELARLRSDYEQAEAFLRESLIYAQQTDDIVGYASSLNYLAYLGIIGDSDNVATVRAYAEESAAILRQAGNPAKYASVLNSLGLIISFQGQSDEAAKHLKESLVLFRDIQDTRGVGIALNDLGEVARQQDDYEWAEACYTESLSCFRAMGDRELIGIVLHNLGCVAQHQGALQQAAPYFAEGLVISQEIGDPRNIADCLKGLAGVASGIGEGRQAASLFGAASALRDSIGARMGPADQAEYDPWLGNVRDQLGEAAFAAAWEEGQHMSIGQAIAQALACAKTVCSMNVGV